MSYVLLLFRLLDKLKEASRPLTIKELIGACLPEKDADREAVDKRIRRAAKSLVGMGMLMEAENADGSLIYALPERRGQAGADDEMLPLKALDRLMATHLGSIFQGESEAAREELVDLARGTEEDGAINKAVDFYRFPMGYGGFLTDTTLEILHTLQQANQNGYLVELDGWQAWPHHLLLLDRGWVVDALAPDGTARRVLLQAIGTCTTTVVPASDEVKEALYETLPQHLDLGETWHTAMEQLDVTLTLTEEGWSRFDPESGDYLTDPGTRSIRFRHVLNGALVRFVLGLGAGVMDIQPRALRDRVGAEYRAMAASFA